MWEDVGYVDPGVVERLIQRLPYGLGNLAADAVRVEAVHSEGEVREGGFDYGKDVRVGVDGEEMEGGILGAGGMLQNG